MSSLTLATLSNTLLRDIVPPNCFCCVLYVLAVVFKISKDVFPCSRADSDNLAAESSLNP